MTRYLLCCLVIFAVMVGYADHNGPSAAAEVAAETSPDANVGVNQMDIFVDEAEAYQMIGEPQKEIACYGCCRPDGVATQYANTSKIYNEYSPRLRTYDTMLWSWSGRGPVHQWLMS